MTTARAGQPKTEAARRLNGLLRPSLRAQRRVAHFIAAYIFDVLVERKRLRAEVARAVRQAVRQRIERARFDRGGSAPAPAGLSEPEDALRRDDPAMRDGVPGEGGIDPDEVVLEALSRSEDAMAFQALSHHADLPEEMVTRILDSGSPRGICALAWRAGMSAAAAVALQMGAGGVPEDMAVHPGPGGRFGLPEDEMEWYLDFFAGLGPRAARPDVPGAPDAEPDAD